jgi:regulator of cell morphogenesis and NO signaling
MERNRNDAVETDPGRLTLSEIVRRNYKTSEVFEKYNLDFCCRGDKLLTDACEERGVDSSVVFEELQSIKSDSRNSENYSNRDLDFLIDYIVNTHHAYINKMIPVIVAHTQKISVVHGKNHPELIQVSSGFERVYKDLKQHMLKEEQILFPFIKQLVNVRNKGLKSEPPFFGTVKNPIRMMEAEHQAAGDELHEIRDLANNYEIPEDACETYRITMQELKEFEEDLHKHVYLENYILFPRSVELEQELL